MHSRNDDPSSESRRYREEDYRRGSGSREDDRYGDEREQRRSSGQRNYPGFGPDTSPRGGSDYERDRFEEYDRPERGHYGQEGRYGQEGWAQGQYGAGGRRQRGRQDSARGRSIEDWGRTGPGHGRQSEPEDQYGGLSEYGQSGEQYGDEPSGRRQGQESYGQESNWRSAGRGQSGSQRGQDFSDDYLRWRTEKIRKYDEDYSAWCQERQKQFSDEFNTWRKGRSSSEGSAQKDAGSPSGEKSYTGSSGSYGSTDDKNKKKNV